MHVDLTKKPQSSFLSCGKDTELILRKLFVENRRYSNELKRLLLINTKDCMDLSNENYQRIIEQTSLGDLVENKYIRLVPKIGMPEHEEVKSYIILSFDNFTPSGNTEHRDNIIHIDILSHLDYWDIGNFEIRPIKIAGYIDGILNRSKLTGIGELNFMGMNELILDENLGGYSLMYEAVHSIDGDDKIPGGDM